MPINLFLGCLFLVHIEFFDSVEGVFEAERKSGEAAEQYAELTVMINATASEQCLALFLFSLFSLPFFGDL